MNIIQKFILVGGYILAFVLLVWTPWDVKYETTVPSRKIDHNRSAYFKRHPFWRISEISEYHMWNKSKVTRNYSSRHNLYRYSLVLSKQRLLIELGVVSLTTVICMALASKTKE